MHKNGPQAVFRTPASHFQDGTCALILHTNLHLLASGLAKPCPSVRPSHEIGSVINRSPNSSPTCPNHIPCTREAVDISLSMCDKGDLVYCCYLQLQFLHRREEISLSSYSSKTPLVVHGLKRNDLQTTREVSIIGHC
jgi:hypothetical protein